MGLRLGVGGGGGVNEIIYSSLSRKKFVNIEYYIYIQSREK